MSSDPYKLTQEGLRQAARCDLASGDGHMDYSSPTEKHFVLPPILYADRQHILLATSSY